MQSTTGLQGCCLWSAISFWTDSTNIITHTIGKDGGGRGVWSAGIPHM